jgi:hypothetical protein
MMSTTQGRADGEAWQEVVRIHESGHLVIGAALGHVAAEIVSFERGWVVGSQGEDRRSLEDVLSWRTSSGAELSCQEMRWSRLSSWRPTVGSRSGPGRWRWASSSLRAGLSPSTRAGSNFDTVVAAYVSTGAGLQQVACVDDEAHPLGGMSGRGRSIPACPPSPLRLGDRIRAAARRHRRSPGRATTRRQRCETGRPAAGRPEA